MDIAAIQAYVEQMPTTPGVYLMRSGGGEVLYIGKAKSLKNRVSSYFQPSSMHAPKIESMVRQVGSIDVIQVNSEVEALILEARLIREVQPKYNTRQKDNKSYPYLVISKENFPGVMVARRHECVPEDNYEYYGPYVDTQGLKASVRLLQRIFKFRTCDLNLSRLKKYFRPCLLASIGYCSAPCAGRIAPEVYRQDIESLRQFLAGDGKKLLEVLQKEMNESAQKLEFEKAAKIRDQIRSLQSLDKHPLVGDFLPGDMLTVSPYQSLLALQETLRLDERPRVIEGIDISHHCGKEAVGSLVAFVDGIPYKEGYRRYKIGSAPTDDDFAMLAEVIERRFTGQDKDRAIPDIFLVDGGKGQLQVATKKLQQLEIHLPAIVALAKKNEEIYAMGHSLPLNLPKNSLVHRLLCAVRDEAHRFATSYHRYLQHSQIKPRKEKNCERERPAKDNI